MRNPNRLFSLLVILWGLMAACSAPSAAAPQPAVEQSSSASGFSEPEVTLLTPLPEAEWQGASLMLEWSWYRELKDNERFDVRVWRDGEPAYGITWVRVRYLNLDNWLLNEGDGRYNWTVAVVQVEGRQVVREVAAAEPRAFTVREVANPVKALILPEGFAASLVGSVQNPTSLALADDGTLYVSQLNGDILRQSANDRPAARFELFASGFEMPTGLLATPTGVFVSSIGQVTELRDSDGDGIGEPVRTLFQPGELPGRQYDAHSNNGLALGPDGHLYITVGGTSGKGPETHPLGGVILRYDLAAGTYTVFARGLRNPYDLTFDPEGNLYASDNGPEVPDYELPVIPPDEINLIREGKDYGYPRYFGVPPPDSGTEAPLLQIPASSVATGLIVYSGQAFPARYQRAIFVTTWGATNIIPPAGHRLTVIPRSAQGEYLQSAMTDFVTGFRNPIDVVQSEVGGLYVADFGTGHIFHITYAGVP